MVPVTSFKQIRVRGGYSVLEQPADNGAATWRRAALLVTSLFFMWGLSYGLLDVLNISGLRSALRSIKDLESLRRKYASVGDKEGLRLVRETAINGKNAAIETAERTRIDQGTRQINAEIAQWFTIWLQTPEVFETWVDLRQRAQEFIDKFGQIK